MQPLNTLIKERTIKKKTMNENKTYNKPVHINEDVWFYVNPKSFDFVVWQEINGKRKAIQFRITHSKLKKYFNN